MKLSKIAVSNFGPIKTGTFDRRKINVFFGPNNSGKSMLARLIYALNKPVVTDGFEDYEIFIYRRAFMYSKTDWRAYSYLLNILRIINGEGSEIVRHQQKNARIVLTTPKGPISVSIKPTRKDPFGVKIDKGVELLKKVLGQDSRQHQSVYVPAARTGTIQYFNSFSHMRSRLLKSIINTFGSSVAADKFSPAELRRFLRSLGKFPLYLEDFFDLILESYTEGFTADLEENFHQLFKGSLQLKDEKGLTIVEYRDQSGFSTEIEKAGSGVISSYPILLGLIKVRSGGTFVVEEPEVHLEPTKQMDLVRLLCDSTYKKNLTLVLTTHSEYLLNKILGMVNKGIISNKDVGLFYFDRTQNNYTTIRQFNVDKYGEADQPSFKNAVDVLIKDFS